MRIQKEINIEIKLKLFKDDELKKSLEKNFVKDK